ncbi:MAG: nitronate monooxygenase family protein [bacterium]|nr:nitronate monooxygenase family protein [bacterium]
MLRTPLCDLLGIEVPIIQAGMSRFTSAELVAAVSNAGGLGSLGCDLRPVDDLTRQLARIRELTDRPFAINHLLLTLDDEAFARTLEARPPVVSLAGADPGELVQRAHDAGARVIQQVHTVQQACQAAERGVDVIIAQGTEAGGHGGTVATLALIPQVVDAVRPIPVVAAGGIADGRGLAAALILGADGINIGTRFLASVEAPISQGWKQMIVEANSEDAVKVEVWNDINPPPRSGGYGTVLRAIRTSFIDEWQQRRDEAKRDAERLRGEVLAAMQQGRLHELLPVAGQSAGLIRDIVPAGDIVRSIVAEAQETLKRATTLLT